MLFSIILIGLPTFFIKIKFHHHVIINAANISQNYTEYN